MKALFVCYANVSRSQMVEAIFNRLADGKVTAVSARSEALRRGVNASKVVNEIVKDNKKVKLVMEAVKAEEAGGGSLPS